MEPQSIEVRRRREKKSACLDFSSGLSYAKQPSELHLDCPQCWTRDTELSRGCQSAAHPHNLLVFWKKKKEEKKRKERKHQNSLVGLRCFTEARARGRRERRGARWHCLGPPRHSVLTDWWEFSSHERSLPGGLHVGVKSSPVTPERGQENTARQHDKPPNVLSPGGGFVFFGLRVIRRQKLQWHQLSITL